MNIKLHFTLWLLIFSFFNNQYSFANNIIVPASPAIAATSYLLMDFNSGKILVENNIHQKLPPASLTKIMTIYVVANELDKGTISFSDAPDIRLSNSEDGVTGIRPPTRPNLLSSESCTDCNR